jgi:hypothetical protein
LVARVPLVPFLDQISRSRHPTATSTESPNGRRATQVLHCSFIPHPPTDVIPSSLRYALPGSSMCLHLHLPSSPPRTTTERLYGVANITQPARGATARGPMQHPCPRRRGAACWVWLRSGSATSPPPRIITMWSRLPDGMDDFPWRRSGCGDADAGVATGTRLWPCRRRDDTDERPPPPVPNLCCAWIGPPLPRREYPPTLPVPKVITDCLECFCGARDWLQDRLSGVITDYM